MITPTRANQATWRKSTRSGAGATNCVEVTGDFTASDNVVLVRDSKDASGPFLTASTGAWASFVSGVTTGAIDL